MDRIGAPKQYVPIFVSSTHQDLKDYRTAVREALHRLEIIVRGMEYFGSKPDSPKDECLKAVKSCHVYIGIFAMRYGSIDEETGKSMTHLEYEEAQRLGLLTLIYLIDEENQPVLPKFVDIGENARKLADLKAELKQRLTVSFFTTPEDLAKRISQDLPPILQDIEVEVQKEEKEIIPTEAKDEMKVKGEEEEEKGFLDFVVDGEMSMKDIKECTERITQGMQEVAKKIQQRADEVQKITQSRIPGTASRVHKIATVAASNIISYAEKLEEEQPKFHNAWESFDENITGLLQATRIYNNENDKEEDSKFRSQMKDLRSKIRNALESLRSYREAVENLKGISRDVNRASRRMSLILTLLISDLQRARLCCTKVMDLLDDNLEQEG